MDYIQEDVVREFISKLPEIDLNPPTTHLMMLACRSKKAKEVLQVKIKDLVISRKIIRPIEDWRTRYFNGVYNLALLQHKGRFNYRDILLPPETMGIYATLKPRHVLRAVVDLMKDNMTYLYQYSTSDSAGMQLAKETSRFFGKLHKHKARGRNFVTLDLDVLDKTILKEVLDEVSMLPKFMMTETSGGYHVVLDLTKPEDAKTFWGQESVLHKLRLNYADKGLEIQRDSQEPIPGTLYYRGKGVPHYVSFVD